MDAIREVKKESWLTKLGGCWSASAGYPSTDACFCGGQDWKLHGLSLSAWVPEFDCTFCGKTEQSHIRCP